MPSTTPSPGPVDPDTALRKGGLTLPENADDVTAEVMDVSTSLDLEGYRVTFTLPRANATGFCTSGGLDGDRPAVRLTAQEQDAIGADVKVGAGSRLCSSLWPENTAWNRLVIIDAGDPAVVHVAVTKMGR